MNHHYSGQNQSEKDGEHQGSPLIDAEQLGHLMRLTESKKAGAAAAAVNQRIHRGYPMPPPVNLPGSRRRVWMRSRVIDWLESRSTERG